jgi:uncharacterized membrane protein YccC
VSDDATTPADDRPVLKLGDHARAQRSIARVKAWAGLAGLVLGLVLGRKAGLPLADTLARALLVGTVAYLVGWAGAVLVWRQVAAAELEVAKRRLLAALDEAEALAATRTGEPGAR